MSSICGSQRPILDRTISSKDWWKIFLVLAAGAFLVSCSARGEESKFTIHSGGSDIDVTVADGAMQLSSDQIHRWLQNAADSVAAYYGKFPVPHPSIVIRPFEGHGVRGGRTFGGRGGYISIRLGSASTDKDLDDDWELAHEMVHLSFPDMPDKNHWIEEGIATYVEPIARIQAGHYDAATMWMDLVENMPKGEPAEGDQGLDNTHTWGRTYWGGALFCFAADVEIRRETKNKKGLQDALRAVLDAGGDIRQDWELADALKIGDRATGTHVLMDLYKKMGDSPTPSDLDALWKQLGISVQDGRIHFQDDAELAAVRKSITMPMPAAKH